MAAVEMQGVSVSYGRKEAVKDCSLSIEKGETLGLLGPNGAGKTSLLQAITGQKAFRGRIRVFGKDASKDESAIYDLLGIAPQEFAFFESFSVEENLRLLADLHGLRGKGLEKRIADVLKEFGLEKFRKVKADSLSGGYKRLLNMAVSFIHPPALAILDEPTVGLDPDMRDAVWQVIRGMQKQGVTIVLTTHYLDEAEEICDRIAIIYDGKVRACGTPKQLELEQGGDTHITGNLTGEGKLDVAKVKEIAGVTRVEIDGNRLSVWCETQKAEQVLAGLMHALYPRRLRLKNLSFKKPTLKEVFSSVVGRGLELH